MCFSLDQCGYISRLTDQVIITVRKKEGGMLYGYDRNRESASIIHRERGEIDTDDSWHTNTEDDDKDVMFLPGSAHENARGVPYPSTVHCVRSGSIRDRKMHIPKSVWVYLFTLWVLSQFTPT